MDFGSVEMGKMVFGDSHTLSPFSSACLRLGETPVSDLGCGVQVGAIFIMTMHYHKLKSSMIPATLLHTCLLYLRKLGITYVLLLVS